MLMCYESSVQGLLSILTWKPHQMIADMGFLTEAHGRQMHDTKKSRWFSTWKHIRSWQRGLGVKGTQGQTGNSVTRWWRCYRCWVCSNEKKLQRKAQTVVVNRVKQKAMAEWCQGGADVKVKEVLPSGHASVAEEQLCCRFHIPGFRGECWYYCILCAGRKTGNPHIIINQWQQFLRNWYDNAF